MDSIIAVWLVDIVVPRLMKYCLRLLEEKEKVKSSIYGVQHEHVIRLSVSDSRSNEKLFLSFYV